MIKYFKNLYYYHYDYVNYINNKLNLNDLFDNFRCDCCNKLLNYYINTKLHKHYYCANLRCKKYNFWFVILRLNNQLNSDNIYCYYLIHFIDHKTKINLVFDLNFTNNNYNELVSSFYSYIGSIGCLFRNENLPLDNMIINIKNYKKLLNKSKGLLALR